MNDIISEKTNRETVSPTDTISPKGTILPKDTKSPKDTPSPKDTMLLFDLDGTLWDSAVGVRDSWNQILQNELVGYPLLTTADIHSVMGLSMDKIAEHFFGDFTRERRMELLELCETNESRHMAKVGGKLMPNVRETLSELRRRGYRMAIISNCQIGYIEAFYTSMKMEEFFCDKQDWGTTKLVKGENIRLVMKRHNCVLKREDATPETPFAVYIGDTQGDCDAADLAGIPFYHAAYGFGKVTHAERVLNTFSDLLDIFL